jgi:hypothetical protein
MKRDVLDDAIAFIEDAEHGDALRHRRNSALSLGGRGDLACLGKCGILLFGALAARNQRKPDTQRYE